MEEFKAYRLIPVTLLCDFTEPLRQSSCILGPELLHAKLDLDPILDKVNNKKYTKCTDVLAKCLVSEKNKIIFCLAVRQVWNNITTISSFFPMYEKNN